MLDKPIPVVLDASCDFLNSLSITVVSASIIGLVSQLSQAKDSRNYVFRNRDGVLPDI